jgi:uncharacterized membrane protein
MAAILQSLEKTIAAGVALLIVIIVLVGLITGQFIRLDANWWALIVRWLHVGSGIMWIGLLWYFNFVQTPTMPKIEPVEHRAAVTKYIAPSALFWFRYGALATVIFGLILAWQNSYLIPALSFQKPFYTIGIGMWLALIIAFNVWFIIWPNQQKALGLVDVPADQKPKAGRIAMLTSRVNAALDSDALLHGRADARPFVTDALRS